MSQFVAPRLARGWSRRTLLAGGAASLSFGLSACGKKEDAAPKDDTKATRDGPQTIEAAVEGDWRRPEDKARDKWRHPVDSLKFWGLKPGMTVVEFWPGAGWYADIIAPFLAATGGKLYEANLELGPQTSPASRSMVEGLTHKLEEKPRLYGKVEVTAFGPTSGPVAPAGSADLVLFLRNLHNWMAAGIADKAFRDAFAALKPGGILGVEEHRADPGGVPDLLAQDGYVQQAYAIQLAKDAGFVLSEASEVNANPKDTKDHPFGVWTLPPTRLSAPRGEPPRDDFDHSTYDAIGESDRMTLRFEKPK